MTASVLPRWLSKRHLKVQKQRPHPGTLAAGSGHAALLVSHGAAQPHSVCPGAAPVPGGKPQLRVFEKHHTVAVVAGLLVGLDFCFVFCLLFVGRTAIRRKEGRHPGREKAPSPGSTGRSSPALAGKADPAGFASKSWDSLFPEPIARRKSPRDGKHQTLATVMYREQHLLFTVWGWFVFFSCFLYFFFLLFCPVGSYGDAAAAACPGAVGKGAPSPSPSAAPRQQHSRARTCPEVSSARRDAGFLRGGRTDPAGGEEPSRDVLSQDSPLARRFSLLRKDSLSCEIGIFRSLE